MGDFHIDPEEWGEVRGWVKDIHGAHVGDGCASAKVNRTNIRWVWSALCGAVLGACILFGILFKEKLQARPSAHTVAKVEQ